MVEKEDMGEGGGWAGIEGEPGMGWEAGRRISFD